MAKFFGPVGYSDSKEASLGVWVDEITEYTYYGDIIKNVSKIRSADGLNDNLVIENQVSIVADEFAYTNFQSIRYTKWMGAFWKVTSVTVQRPRLLLTLGGVYNGPFPNPPPVEEDEIPNPPPVEEDET